MKKLRQQVKDSRSQNALGWQGQGNPSQLSQQLSQAIDGCVKQLWESTGLTDIALVAVGGYGRGELAPFSDIDLLILLPASSDAQRHEIAIASFVTGLWDIGLDAGHSVRDIDECILQAQNDLTVATALLESRLLAGPQDLLSALQARWQSSIRLDWFVQGKKLELRQRHSRFQDSPYSLEPNIKESPGGLRDLQVIRWIATALGVGTSWKALEAKGLLTPEESKQLQQQQTVLLNLRAQLHLLANRREDRLVFDLQNRLAAQLGLEATKGRRASELLMQRYYRAAKVIYKVTAILLAELDAPACITGEGSSSQQEVAGKTPPKARKIDDYFYEDRGLLDIRDETIFKEDPSLLLKSFLVMQKESSHRGMTARTLRALWNNRELIDRKFREKPENKALFLEIFKQPRGIVHALRIMNDLGLLGRMLPVFRRIVGQMQHDLFHVYTVDQHSLFVLRNLRRMTIPEHRHELPFASELIQKIVKPERLYLAGLFHDIAKGRGGDHSTLGEKEAEAFCRLHNLSDYDTRFICWLVRYHLIMSATAQREDISDPDVVHRFAAQVGDQEHLDNLYLLTVADMRGTSPAVWNAWKGRLLAQLYTTTAQLLRRGIATPHDIDAHIADLRREALALLRHDRVSPELAAHFWQNLEPDYFLRYDADSLAWHARAIARTSSADLPVVATRYSPDLGGSEFLFYTPDRDDLFSVITGGFDRLNLSIVDARVHTLRNGFALDTFVVLDSAGESISDQRSLKHREQAMRQQLLDPKPGRDLQQARLPRTLQQFPIETRVQFTQAPSRPVTIMEVTAQDRPGLLYQMALALKHCNVNLVAAKVATYGERAEDIFFINTHTHAPLAAEQELCLNEEITRRLGSPSVETRTVTI